MSARCLEWSRTHLHLEHIRLRSEQCLDVAWRRTRDTLIYKERHQMATPLNSCVLGDLGSLVSRTEAYSRNWGGEEERKLPSVQTSAKAMTRPTLCIDKACVCFLTCCNHSIRGGCQKEEMTIGCVSLKTLEPFVGRSESVQPQTARQVCA